MADRFKRITIIRIICIFLPLILFTSCKLVECRKFDKDWNERFSNAASLSEYATKNGGSIHLIKIKLEHYEVEGIRLDQFTVENGSLSNIGLLNANINTLTIMDSDLQKVDFSDSIIHQLNIRKSNLEDFYCKRCEINHIRFLDSNLKKNDLRIKNNATTTVFNCYVDDSSFYSSKIKDFKITNSTFSANESFFDYLETDYLLIKDSSINVDLKESKIKTTVLENVTGPRAGFARMEGDTFLIKDSNLEGLSLGSVKKLNYFESRDSSFYGLGIRAATVGQVVIQGCIKKSGLSFAGSKIAKIEIDNCNLEHFQLRKASINELTISNSDLIIPKSLFDGIWDRMHIKTFTLDNVFIQGHFDMEQARVDHLVKKNLRKSKNLKINYKGANFRL